MGIDRLVYNLFSLKDDSCGGDGEDDMGEIVIASVAEFQARLQELERDETCLLYRGQPDAGWPVSCSAARRLTQDPANLVEGQLIDSLLIGYLESLIARARMRGFLPPGLSDASADLELLAQLQHQGAATGLIDFTRQPTVALWFACNDSYETDGAVYVLPRSATEEINNSRDFEKRIQALYDRDVLWSWEPSARGNRIVAQSSVFVLGAPAVSSDKMERLTVQADSKRDMLRQLETVYGVNEEMLFSDFPGYAVANASNKSYDISRSVSYWQEQVGLVSDENERAVAHFNCGVAHSATRDFQSAAEQYSKAIVLNPEHGPAYTNRGIAKDALGRFKDAIADFDEAIRIDPQNDKAFFGRGSAKASLGRYSEAIEDYDVALRINPRYAIAYLGRGDVEAGLGQLPAAITDYNRALGNNPEYAEAYNGRGRIKYELERYEEAIADFNMAIGLNSKHAETYFNRGNAKTKLNRTKEAIADYDKAIGIKSEFGKAHFNRGTAKFVLGLREEAIEDYDKVIRINPEHVGAYYSRGKAKKSLRQFAEAEEDLKRAQTLAEQQGPAALFQAVGRELDNLYPEPFQVIPHHSGYVEGIDPNKLKEFLFGLNDVRFKEE